MRKVLSSLRCSIESPTSDSIRIASFHSYFEPQLFYQPFNSSFNQSKLDDSEEVSTTNQLVVDVLIRTTNGNSCSISQTNNGEFRGVGSFTVEDITYEIYQKIIDYSSAGEQKLPISLNPKFDLKSTVPSKIDTVQRCLSSVLNPTNIQVEYTDKPLYTPYILFSQDFQMGSENQANSLSICDKDKQMKIALYSKHALSGFASVLSKPESVTVCRCEIKTANCLLHGECYYTSTELCIFDEASLSVQRFPIKYEENLISMINFDNQEYINQGSVDESNEKHASLHHYIFA